MATVKNILDLKPAKTVFSVPPDVTVYRAIELMCEKNIGGLVIVEEEKLVGIFTERDYARKLILKGKSSKDTLIRELMTPNPITVRTDSTVEDCMKIMTDKKIRHLPVVDGDQLVGVISIGDLVRQIIEEQKFIIENLEHYITGH
jgi:CBS domain-containing protein